MNLLFGKSSLGAHSRMTRKVLKALSRKGSPLSLSCLHDVLGTAAVADIDEIDLEFRPELLNESEQQSWKTNC